MYEYAIYSTYVAIVLRIILINIADFMLLITRTHTHTHTPAHIYIYVCISHIKKIF